MTWKIKDLKEFCSEHEDYQVVKFLTWSEYSESYTKEVPVDLEVRNPKRNEFTHKECLYCEKMNIKGNERLYCNKKEDFIPKYDNDGSSCDDDFDHQNGIVEFLE